jgi:hypothetical protein
MSTCKNQDDTYILIQTCLEMKNILIHNDYKKLNNRHLGISLTDKVNELYNENHKTLTNHIEEETKK